MQRVRFGVIGCGRVSGKHLEALSSVLNCTELIAVCDCNPDRAERAGTKYGVPWYDNSITMLERHPEIEVIDILTPSGLHAQNVLELSKFAKHFVVEKPMALSLSDAEAMIRACDQNGTRLFVVKQNRYNLPIVKLREAVTSGRFGKFVMGTVRVRWCRPQTYYDQDSWRGTWSMDGGVLANQASHHIDMLTWMMGDVESVFAFTATRLVNIEAEDTAVATLKFTNGALGIVEATTGTRPRDLEGSISILGERGTVEVGGFAMNEMRTWAFEESLPGDEHVFNNFKENPPDVYGFGHARFLQNVVSALREGKGGVVDGVEGIKSLTLINALYESMETEKKVTLRFRPQRARLGHS